MSRATPRTFTRYAEKGSSSRFWMWIAATLLFLLGVATIGGWLWLNNYLRSEAFRRLLSARTSDLLQVEGDFAPFQWSGDSVYTESFRGDGMPGSWINHLQAESLRSEVDLSGLRDRVWLVPKVDVRHLRLALAGTKSQRHPPSASAVASPALSRWIPSRVVLKETHIEQADISWSEGTLERTRLSIRPSANDTLIHGVGGTLSVKSWPKFTVQDFDLRWSDGVTYLLQSRLSHANGGELSATGQLGGARGSHLRLEFQGLPSETVLEQKLAHHLRGILRGSVDLQQARAEAPWLAKGEVILRDGMLRDLPTLRLLARFTGLVQFENLVLQQTEMRFEQFPDRFEITNLVSESEGLLRVEGTCTLSMDRIQGTFEVGVTPAALRWVPGAREKVFTSARGPYLFTTVHISGSPSSPQNDLEPRLTAALEGAVIDTVNETLEGATETIKDTTRGVLDILLPR